MIEALLISLGFIIIISIFLGFLILWSRFWAENNFNPYLALFMIMLPIWFIAAFFIYMKGI